jgi:hypothetical protein
MRGAVLSRHRYAFTMWCLGPRTPLSTQSLPRGIEVNLEKPRSELLSSRPKAEGGNTKQEIVVLVSLIGYR